MDTSGPWFTSDTHFHHKRIIDFCDRPYRTDDGHPDVEAMNEDLIKRWNEVVQPDDDVYHLGDVCFGGTAKMMAIGERLNGHKHLILGNHDHLSRSTYRRAGFETVAKKLVLGRMFLVHAPPPASVCDDYSLVICGHVHERWRCAGNKVNVGVDQWGFRPVNLDAMGLSMKLLKPR